MKPTILIFQSSQDLSWRDKLDGAYVFAKGAGWQMHVIGADARTAEIRQSIRQWKPIGCIEPAAHERAAGLPPRRIHGRRNARTANREPENPDQVRKVRSDRNHPTGLQRTFADM